MYTPSSISYFKIMAPSSARRLACSHALAPREASIVPPVGGFGGGGFAVSHVFTTTLNYCQPFVVLIMVISCLGVPTLNRHRENRLDSRHRYCERN